MLPPLLFEPILKRIRWGGRRLGTRLGKHIGSETDYAESWEIADHADGCSRVRSGPLAGQSLPSLMQQFGTRLMGRGYSGSQFPLLIKFLDANDWLSLQVHPDDLLARQYAPGENGKTEAWVILDALPDSRLCTGLKPGMSAELLRTALQNGTIESCLHLIPAQPGDCIFVPAGTVHALGPGILLAEVQQQSNLTFRLYDWGRVDSSGKPRPVHLKESLECTDFERGPAHPVTPAAVSGCHHNCEELVRCDFFVIRRHRTTVPVTIPLNDAFRILMVLDGHGTISSPGGALDTVCGDTVLVPAESPEIRLSPQTPMTVLEVFSSD